jgi:hypothetical protein
MESSYPAPMGLRVFSTYAKADAFRKVLMEKYPNYSNFYVESIEVDE